MADGQVVFEITADGKHAIASVKDVTAAIEQESKKWDKSAKQSTDNVGGSFDGMLKKLAAGFTAAKVGQTLLSWGKAAVAAASDLEEVQNVVDVTFGDGARQIDAWAKQAITQFGLTETQAKRFTSTMGAMMKSAGLAGPEIVTMSEDLAGLAADMSSFYNMDFDTAFQKIRSGISGETEPLKSLGINMSVANLEAFALEKGITKAFNAMSQGEQVQLRYQYLMQATADAQGDFARTSDGYANGLRLLESNLESIKTTIGSVFIGTLASATSGLNDFLTKLTHPKPRTVLDDFADIDMDTEQKLAKIQTTADEANALIDVLEELGRVDAGKAMESLAKGANTLNSGSPGTWHSLLDALQQVDGLQNVFSNTGAGKNVEELAAALSGSSPDTDKAEAWRTFLGALSENADALTALTGTSADETKKWLEEIAAAANTLDPGDAEGWDKLLSNFVTGLPGLADTKGGKAFFDAMAANFLAMGKDSETARRGLEALGFGTEEISDRQKTWLEVCKQLVKTIPGLSEIINTETGEIQGGTKALDEHVAAYQRAQEKIILWEAYYAKERALLNAENGINTFKIESMGAERAAKQAKQQLDAIRKRLGLDEDFDVMLDQNVGVFAAKDVDEFNKALFTWIDAEDKAADATAEYNRQLDAQKGKTEELDNIKQALIEEYGAEEKAAGGAADAAEGAAESLSLLQRAMSGTDDEAKKAVKGAIEEYAESLEKVTEYAQKMHQAMEQNIDQVIKGFDKVITPVQQADKEVYKLNQQIAKLQGEQISLSGSELEKNKKQIEEINQKINELGGDKPSLQNMTKGLEEQLKYMREYQENLAKARAAGISDDLLAMVADGSAQNADYVAELATAGAEEVKAINKAYADVQAEKQKFADSLTQYQLTADDEFTSLVATTNEKMGQMLEALDVGEEAKSAAETTVQGIVDGLDAKALDVQAAVDKILGMLAQLAGMDSYGIGLNGTNFTFSPAATGSLTPPSTPGSGFLRISQTLNLDGKTIGQSVSDYQARELETLERSGINDIIPR